MIMIVKLTIHKHSNFNDNRARKARPVRRLPRSADAGAAAVGAGGDHQLVHASEVDCA